MSCRYKCLRLGVCSDECPLGNDVPCRDDCEVVEDYDLEDEDNRDGYFGG